MEFLSQAAALIATFPNAVQREVYGRRAAEAAGITPEAMQLEIKKSYRKARAIEQKKQEAQELDIARQRAPKTRAIRYDNLRSATAEEGLICTLLREPELIANVKLPAEAFSVDLFGRVLADLRQRVQSGRPVSLAALGPDLTPEEMAHLSYVMSRDTAPVSDEAFADYLRVIQEEYEGRSLTRSEENLRRVEKHRRQRRDLRFTTLELPHRVGAAAVENGSVVLLEDVSNLLANVMFERGGNEESVYGDIEALLSRCRILVAVTITGLREDGYDGETAAYIRALNGLNQRLLARAAAALTMKDGQPFAEKGELNEII